MLTKIKKEIDRFGKKLFRSSEKDKQLEELQYKLDNLPYEIYDKIRHGTFDLEIPKMKSIEETLARIIQDRCSMSRFGDGEFACMRMSRIAYHDPSEELAKRLKEVISSDIPNMLIGLADCFGSLDHYVPYTQKFWRKYMSKKRNMTYAFLDMKRTYYNAFFNRFYLNYVKTDEHYRKAGEYFKKLKEIWKDRDVVILESETARLGVGNDLLEGAKSISRILFCPVRNSFNRYDEILSAFDGINTDTLILAALGPTATVLAYDLSKKGYQALDFGLIGEEYECFLRKDTPLEQISAGHIKKIKHIPNPITTEYKSQIIKKIV